jgi:peptidoglycan/LPS O-acetylase OafA/YrhL
VHFPRQNNLEWLRLLFAVQVVATHSVAHLGMARPVWLAAFPGVPAFFFVSGFLIYAAYQNSSLPNYIRNRLLRLIPALVAVTLGGVLVALVAHGWRDILSNPGIYAAWLFAQITLGQAYNPEHFRDIGVGVINGSLWTITTEILFYIFVPIIVFLEKHIKYSVIILTIFSFLFYASSEYVFSGYEIYGKSLFDYFYLTPIYWGWMFGLGIISYKYWNSIYPYMSMMPLLLLPMILMLIYGDGGVWFNGWGQRMGFLYFLCYCGVILYLAFGVRPIPLSFDISYGTYIWHMPIINLLLVLRLSNVVLAFALTLGLALLSWFLIERPFLRLKRSSLHRVPVANGVPLSHRSDAPIAATLDD